MANWNTPTLSSEYADFLSLLEARLVDLAKMFDGQTVSNLPTDAIRWNGSANRFEIWNGTSWAELTSTYSINADQVDGEHADAFASAVGAEASRQAKDAATVGGSAKTTFAYRANNLSDLGSATTARSNLGLGSAAVQADTRYAHRSNNLSDLGSAATARTNLGLGNKATSDQTVSTGNPSGGSNGDVWYKV